MDRRRVGWGRRGARCVLRLTYSLVYSLLYFVGLRAGSVDNDSFPQNTRTGEGGEVVYIIGYDRQYVQDVLALTNLNVCGAMVKRRRVLLNKSLRDEAREKRNQARDEARKKRNEA